MIDFPSSQLDYLISDSILRQLLLGLVEDSSSRSLPLGVSHLAMASEGSPTSRSVTPSVVPQKRAHGLDDEQHVPAVSSPLNPDYAAIRSRKPPPREQREKKESLKKREAKGADSVRSGTPDSQSHPTRKTKKTQKSSNVLSPLRYPLPQPIKTDWETPRPPVFNPFLTRGDRQFHECFEQ